MKRVVIESPLAGDFERNRRYALWCVLDSLRRGEAPFASHLLYPQCLNDQVPGERELGIDAGLAWGPLADLRALYVDFGTSSGMVKGLLAARELGQEVETRVLPQVMFEAFTRGEMPGATVGFAGVSHA